MTTIDFTILDWVQAHLRCGALDLVMPCITYLGEGGVLWVLLALVLLWKRDTRQVGLAVALALVLDLVLCNLILKPLVARPRPFSVREVTLLISPPSDWSFPSGHTAASFASAVALWRSKSRLRVPALALAILIGASRIYLYVHYPSDVLCGGVLGTFCGVLGVFFAKTWMDFCKKSRK
jgi:undecaprenyl-diphosphatase